MPFLAVAAGLVAVSVTIVASYALWLLLARRRPARREAARPPVLVVVPLFDEEPLLAGKLRNLAALDYPALRVVLVDGGSTDATVPLARASGFAVIETTLRSKTAQLNEALRLFPEEEWILVTDADALLEPDTLLRLFDATDDTVGVAGVRVRPAAAHRLESLHWRATDWLRERESDRGSAAIVAAPCYLARRVFLEQLPIDAIADDVHVACRAMVAGQRVAHADATVLELRSPRSIRALLRHKYRKADAYLREIARFLPLAPRMPRAMRAIFLWRAALLTLVPLLATLGAAALLVALLSEIPPSHLGVTVVALFLLLVFRPVRGAARAAMLAALLAGVSAAALLTYPFSRQAASFPKIVQPWEYQNETD